MASTSPLNTIRPDGAGSMSPAGSSEILRDEASPMDAESMKLSITSPVPGTTGWPISLTLKTPVLTGAPSMMAQPS